MDYEKLFAISSEDRRDYYQQKISEHTPPANEHDREMIRMYRRFMELNKLKNLRIVQNRAQ